jgi:hypothetical protein
MLTCKTMRMMNWTVQRCKYMRTPLYSGVWCRVNRVVLYEVTIISEEPLVSNFKVESRGSGFLQNADNHQNNCML